MALHKKGIIILLLLVSAAALVWAAAKLSGQINALAQDTGSIAADMERLTISAIRTPVKSKESGGPPRCDWQLERNIRKQLEVGDAKYKKLTASAQVELSTQGKVSENTRNRIVASAAEFRGICESYARMWDACGCRTRARTARAAGEARAASAEVLVDDKVDYRHLSRLRATQSVMRLARRDYAVEAVAGQEIGPEDRQDLKTSVAPRVDNLLDATRVVMEKSRELLRGLQSGEFGGGASAGPGGPGGGQGSGSEGGTNEGGGPTGVYSEETLQAIRQVENVRDAGRDLFNLGSHLKEDVLALAGGQTVTPFNLLEKAGMPGASCFVDAAGD